MRLRPIYADIEHFKIRSGGVNMFFEAIAAIDKAIERMANETETIRSKLVKICDSNASKQLQNAVTTVEDLSKCLIEAAEDMNRMQKDIYILATKIADFNNEQFWGHVRELTIERIKVYVDDVRIEMHLSEMKQLLADIIAYHNSIADSCSILDNNKNAMSSWWDDEQYRNVFCPFIEEIIMVVVRKLEAVDEFGAVLHRKIMAIE